MIVPMKKVSLIGLLSQQREVLKELQLFGKVQFIGEADEKALAQAGSAGIRELRGRTASCIDFLESHAGRKRGMFSSLNVVTREVDEDTARELEADTGRLDGALDSVRGLEDGLSDIKQRRERAVSRKALLEPWSGCPTPLEDIKDTKNTVISAGCVLTRDAPAFRARAEESGLIALQEAASDADRTYYIAAVHRDALAQWESIAKLYNFVRTDFGGASGTARSGMEECAGQIEELDREAAAICERAGSGELLEYLEDMSDILTVQTERADTMALSAPTAKCFVMEGWVPAESCEALEKKLNALTDSIIIEFSDPAPEEEPPTLVRNNAIVRPFENIVDAFSHPAYRDIDPNGMVAVFYSLFFGLMVGDAGYGLLLILVCGGILAFAHPRPSTRKLFGLFLAGGVSSALVGIVFGSYFGAPIFPALLPIVSETGMPLQLEIPMELIIFSIALGVIHLFTGYCAMAVKNIRQGKIFAAIFDQGFWMLFITGLLMLAGPIADSGKTGALIGQIGKWTAIVAGAGLVLTQGREKKGIFGKLIGGFASIYNISGFLGDALSYVRIFALGLSSAIIGWVFNLMSGLLGTDSVIGVIFMIFILLLGHAINIGLSLLSAYVHTNRLQYVEFLSKFYDGNGEEFSPLSRRTEYITIVPGKSARGNI